MVFNLIITKLFRRHAEAFKDDSCRLIVSRGGSSSSKTISILQLLLVYAMNNSNVTVSVLGETYPKMKKTVIKDFKNVVMKELWSVGKYNKQEFVYTFPNGSIIQFMAADDEGKVRGIRSDVLYADEINTIKWEVFKQLMIRTKYKVIASFNPSAEFEITEEVNTRADVTEIISTYRDNEFLDENIVRELELQGERDENFRRVFINGEYGTLEGIIYQEGKHWKQVDGLPDEYDMEVWGIDYGYENDPTALVQCRVVGNAIYLKEHIYEKKLLNRDIGKRAKRANNKNKLVIAENARPEINDELRIFHKMRIKKVVKPAIVESVNALKQRDIYVTKDSLNIINEFRNYKWSKKKKDKFGQIMPIDAYNHAIDAIRYLHTETHKPKAEEPIVIMEW